MVVCEREVRDENNSNTEERVPKPDNMANKPNKVKLGKGEQTIILEFEDDSGRSFEATINISNIVIKCKEVIEQPREMNSGQKLPEKNSSEYKKNTTFSSDSSSKKHNDASPPKNVEVQSLESLKQKNVNDTLLKKISDADKLVNEFFKTESKCKNPFEAFYSHHHPAMKFSAVKKSTEEPVIKVEPRENDFVEVTPTAEDLKPTNETPTEKKIMACRTAFKNCQRDMDAITKLLKETDKALEELSNEFLESNLVENEKLSKKTENDSVDVISASQKSSKSEPLTESREKNKILEPFNSILKCEKEKNCSTSVESSEKLSNLHDVESLNESEDKDLTEPDSGYLSANQTTETTTADKENLDVTSKKPKEKPTAVVPGFRRETNARNQPPVETPQPRPAVTQSNREITSPHVSTPTPSNRTNVRTSTAINEISNRVSSTAVRSSTPIHQSQPPVRRVFESSSGRVEELLSPIRIEQTFLPSFNRSLKNDTYDSYRELRITSPSTSSGRRERTMKFDNFISNPRHCGPVTDLPGVGKVGGERLRAAGIRTVGDMHKKYQKLGGDESSFKRWFQGVSGLNSRWASDCYDALDYI